MGKGKGHLSASQSIRFSYSLLLHNQEQQHKREHCLVLYHSTHMFGIRNVCSRAGRVPRLNTGRWNVNVLGISAVEGPHEGDIEWIRLQLTDHLHYLPTSGTVLVTQPWATHRSNYTVVKQIKVQRVGGGAGERLCFISGCPVRERTNKASFHQLNRPVPPPGHNLHTHSGRPTALDYSPRHPLDYCPRRCTARHCFG